MRYIGLFFCILFLMGQADWYATPVAKQIPFDNSANGYSATDVQAAIEETALDAGSSRYAVVFAYNGNASNRWLELFQSNPSDASPFVVAEIAEVSSHSFGCSTSTTATVTLYKNASPLDTLTITAATTNYESGLSWSLAAGDSLSAKITSGSCQDPVYSVSLKVL